MKQEQRKTPEEIITHLVIILTVVYVAGHVLAAWMRGAL